jgi:cysteine desulfurase
MKRVFFDHASATPVDGRVLDAMLPYFTERFGNPSSVLLEEGETAREAVEEARGQVARLIGAANDEIVFTSSATESNNLAIKGLAMANRHRGNRVLFSDVEHYSVTNQADYLSRLGFEVDYVKVDESGVVELGDLERKATPGTILASVMHANFEIGTIQPIERISAILRDRGILLHSDGTASCGRMPVDVAALGVDTMAFSPHLFYGPKGVAALYMRKGTALASQMQGGLQERGYRAGTENVPAIVGFGEAARLAGEEMAERTAHLQKLGRRLWDGLAAAISHMHFTGHPTERIPGHVSFWIEFVEGESLLLWLSLNGVASSSGSACSSNILAADEKGLKASPVLTAIGIPPEICHGSITFSLGTENTMDEVDHALSVVPGIVERLRDMSPLWEEFKKSQRGGS